MIWSASSLLCTRGSSTAFSLMAWFSVQGTWGETCVSGTGHHCRSPLATAQACHSSRWETQMLLTLKLCVGPLLLLDEWTTLQLVLAWQLVETVVPLWVLLRTQNQGLAKSAQCGNSLPLPQSTQRSQHMTVWWQTTAAEPGSSTHGCASTACCHYSLPSRTLDPQLLSPRTFLSCTTGTSLPVGLYRNRCTRPEHQV